MSPEPSQHVPVLAEEVIAWLHPSAGQTIVDGTLGGGGHARLLAQAVGPSGRVLGLDRDPSAVERAGAELRDLPVEAIHANYSDLPEVLRGLNVGPVDGILLMSESCVVGPQSHSHIRCPKWSDDLVLFRRGDDLQFRSRVPVEVEGHPGATNGTISANSRLTREDFTMVFERL
jgi:hypothetical protein